MQWRAQSPEHEAETEDQAHRPQRHKEEKGEWTVKAETGFAQAAILKARNYGRPGTPGEHVEEPGKPDLPAGATRQDDGLKGIEQHGADGEQSEDQAEWVHGCIVRLPSAAG